MSGQYFYQQSFGKDYLEKLTLSGNEYEDCKFENCEFAGADFSGTIFSDCEFINCNLSNVKLTKAAFRDVAFKDCKMLGLHFEDCNPFGLLLHITGSTLDHSSFYGMNLQAIILKSTSLKEVDFTDTNLGKSVFDECDLTGAHFENTNLEYADLRTALNFRINPLINKMKRAKFSSHTIAGLLASFDIEIE